MKLYLYLIIGCWSLTIGCESNPIDPSPIPSLYDAHIKEIENVSYTDKLSYSLGLPAYIPMNRYSYKDPSFNPGDPYQISYIRIDNEKSRFGCLYELHVFDFQTGLNKKIAEEVCSNTTWSSKDWIAYRGSDYNLWIVKSNGDSLTQFTQSSAGYSKLKWSPDGSMLFCQKGRFTNIFNLNGELVHITEVQFNSFSWIDNEKILCGYPTIGGVGTYTMATKQLEILNESPTSHISFYRPEKNDVFTTPLPRNTLHFLRFDLNQGTVDTLERVYRSKIFQRGEYSEQTKRAAIGVKLVNLKDSLRDEFYTRELLVLLDPETLEEKQIVLPE